ncbi:MarR family transcriptional regulator [Allonocardiopsis opalescens]
MAGMTGTRWLDTSEQCIWRSYLAATSLLEDRLDREISAASGLSVIEYGILAHLSEAEGRRMRMSALADTVLVSKSRLSHQVARLERDGHVRREVCPDDRRGAFAVLTDEGYELLVSIAPVHVDGVRTHLFDQLEPEQVQQLAEITRRLVAHLRELPEVVRCPSARSGAGAK